jgi:hypothetical protein
MFGHELIEVYPFESIPLRQLYLMDEKWMLDYEQSLMKLFSDGEDYEHVGYVSYAAALEVNDDALKLSWYPNIDDRHHKVQIILPRSQFVACVECSKYDDKLRLFVKSHWLNTLHLRPYSVFALVDAIGMKKLIESGNLESAKLVDLRNRIDDLASRNPEVAFLSFADNLLLKSNWSVGKYDSAIKYTYEPERIIKLLPEIYNIYYDILGLKAYAVMTQGINEYYDDELLHISAAKNHISLNSLGLPFAQIMDIEKAVRNAIREKTLTPSDLYMDANFFYSLKFKHEFNKNERPRYPYTAPMSEFNYYFTESNETVLNNLEVVL